MLEDTYGYTPIRKAFDFQDVYGIGHDPPRASRKRVRLGIIGAGGVVQSKHWPAIVRLQMIWEPVSVVAFTQPAADQASKVREIFGIRSYSNHHEMLAKEELDGIIVASPDALHAEHTISCLEAGLPVLVEKPVARSLADAERMCRLADEKNLVLMTVANKRFSPPYRRAHKMVADGPLKNPALFVGKFNLGYDYIDLFESGTIHLFDLTNYFMGEVVKVRCVGVNRYKASKRAYPVDNAISTFEFLSGSIGAIYTSASALSLKPWERVELYGDHVWVEIDDQCSLKLYDNEEGPTKSWTPVIPNTLIFDEEFGGYTGLIENFLQAIRGLEDPVITRWDGYRAYELLVASQISLAHAGEAVDLPLDAESADKEAHSWLKKNGWMGEVAY